jgi:hypothetical protein
VLGSLKCDCAEQLALAMQTIYASPPGMVIYLQQEGRGIGLANKIAAYSLQVRTSSNLARSAASPAASNPEPPAPAGAPPLVHACHPSPPTQEQGLDTVDANRALGLPDDCREYTSVRNIIRDLKIKSVKLMVNKMTKSCCCVPSSALRTHGCMGSLTCTWHACTCSLADEQPSEDQPAQGHGDQDHGQGALRGARWRVQRRLPGHQERPHGPLAGGADRWAAGSLLLLVGTAPCRALERMFYVYLCTCAFVFGCTAVPHVGLSIQRAETRRRIAHSLVRPRRNHDGEPLAAGQAADEINGGMGLPNGLTATPAGQVIPHIVQ